MQNLNYIHCQYSYACIYVYMNCILHTKYTCTYVYVFIKISILREPNEFFPASCLPISHPLAQVMGEQPMDLKYWPIPWQPEFQGLNGTRTMGRMGRVNCLFYFVGRGSFHSTLIFCIPCAHLWQLVSQLHICLKLASRLILFFPGCFFFCFFLFLFFFFKLRLTWHCTWLGIQINLLL